jgi:hypothetical protein
MLTVLCVLRSGGPDFTPDYVHRLRNGVERHMRGKPHRFVCISDVPVDCERIELTESYPGWWSKIAMFRPGVITGPTLYLDLDSVIVNRLDPVENISFDFAMLSILGKGEKLGNSGAMWFRKPFPHVYERFAEKPDYWIKYHQDNARNRYMGDQAYISDQFAEIPKLHEALPNFFRSFKYDKCQTAVPAGCSVVCFGGKPRPHEVTTGWVPRVWV